MSRLIDANALIKTFGIADDCQDCQYQLSIFCSRRPDFVVACEAIADAPVIDAVPVVRCRDCEYWKHNSFVLDHDYCELTSTACEEDHFCSWGEKKNAE